MNSDGSNILLKFHMAGWSFKGNQKQANREDEKAF